MVCSEMFDKGLFHVFFCYIIWLNCFFEGFKRFFKVFGFVFLRICEILIQWFFVYIGLLMVFECFFDFVKGFWKVFVNGLLMVFEWFFMILFDGFVKFFLRWFVEGFLFFISLTVF